MVSSRRVAAVGICEMGFSSLSASTEVLNRPHAAFGRHKLSARHHAVLRVRHVDVVTVFAEGLTRAFIPHLLEATADDAAFTWIAGALVLAAASVFADLVAKPGVCTTPIRVVFRVHRGAAFPLAPSHEWRQTLAFATKLVDALNAVFGEITRAWQRGELAFRRRERRFQRASGAMVRRLEATVKPRPRILRGRRVVSTAVDQRDEGQSESEGEEGAK